jgi:hypothetical protein
VSLCLSPQCVSGRALCVHSSWTLTCPFACTRFGSVIALHNDMMVTASPNARYRNGEVYVYRKPAGAITAQYFVLDQTLTPPISTASSLASPPKLEFGFSVDVHADTIVVGCPGQPDAAKSSLPTGAVFVYDRLRFSFHYYLRQVRLWDFLQLRSARTSCVGRKVPFRVRHG